MEDILLVEKIGIAQFILEIQDAFDDFVGDNPNASKIEVALTYHGLKGRLSRLKIAYRHRGGVVLDMALIVSYEERNDKHGESDASNEQRLLACLNQIFPTEQIFIESQADSTFKLLIDSRTKDLLLEKIAQHPMVRIDHEQPYSPSLWEIPGLMSLDAARTFLDEQEHSCAAFSLREQLKRILE